MGPEQSLTSQRQAQANYRQGRTNIDRLRINAETSQTSTMPLDYIPGWDDKHSCKCLGN